jgi:hypothetical protein
MRASLKYISEVGKIRLGYLLMLKTRAGKLKNRYLSVGIFFPQNGTTAYPMEEMSEYKQPKNIKLSCFRIQEGIGNSLGAMCPDRHRLWVTDVVGVNEYLGYCMRAA